MPGKRHSEEQIVYALRQVEGGKKVSEVCREQLAGAAGQRKLDRDNGLALYRVAPGVVA